MRRVRTLVRQSLLILVSVAASAAAQGAVTVTGHVSAASMPVRGATVRIEELNLGATSNAEGRFSFIVPSSRALGQTVPLKASHPRYRSKSINVVLIGSSIEQDFDFCGVRLERSDLPALLGFMRSEYAERVRMISTDDFVDGG